MDCMKEEQNHSLGWEFEVHKRMESKSLVTEKCLMQRHKLHKYSYLEICVNISQSVGWLSDVSQTLEYGKCYKGYWTGELFVK